MPHNLDFIFTLSTALTASLALGYATHRLGLSPIVGYLLAGVAVGPHTPGFIADVKLAEQLAEVGVILLMFGVGLHFHVDELLAVRRIAVPGSLVQCGSAAVLGVLVGKTFGWDWPASIVFGLAIAFASTVVLTRVLGESHDLHTSLGHVAVGWLIVQDLFAVLALVLLPAFFGEEAVEPGKIPLILGLAAAKVGVLVVTVLLAGGRLVPWLLRHVAATRSRELFTLTILVVAMGIALGSAQLFGVSMALGAFLAGMVVGRSDFSVRAATEALPMRDAFAVLFFVSAGMLFDPRFVLDHPLLLIASLAVVLVGTPLATLAVVLRRGYSINVAVGLALALTQIGEFSFILVAMGKDLKLLPPAAQQALVAVAIVTISLNPLVYRLADPLAARLGRRPHLWRWAAKSQEANLPDGPKPSAVASEFRAVVIGFGPVGRTVSRLLRENEIEPTIIEMNIETVKALREQKIPAVYGDATHVETLREAGVDKAASVILSSSGMKGSEEVIRLARELNPDIRVLARSAYVRELEAMHQAGAEVVFSGEGEVAIALTEAILRQLGATPEQIDRERERVRGELVAMRKEETPRTTDGTAQPSL